MLRIQVSDAHAHTPVPCRVHLKLADGSCWMPGAASETVFAHTSAPDVILPSHFDRYLNICQGADIRSIHLTRGEADLDVPPGQVTLYLSRGPEYLPIVDHFEVGPGLTERRYRLERLIDMSAEGWYGGDIHVHVSRFHPEDDHVWLRLMEAEDLHVLNTLIYKHDGAEIQAPQYAVGDRGERRIDDRVLASGEEFRDGDLYGHMIFAGIEGIVEPISVGQRLASTVNYPLFATAADEAHRRGGIVGWAHGGGVFNRFFESLAIEAALGKVDFVEVMQFNMFFGYHFWRELLNCGIKLPCTGGSDFPFGHDLLAPWYPNLGLDRTYVQIEGDFAYRKWLEGIRAGRCFATNGPMLFLTVNGQHLGSEIRLAPSERKVQVQARALGCYPLDHLDIICNGAVVARVDGKARQRELTFEGPIDVDESCWIAAYARGQVVPDAFGAVHPWELIAHTSPVYVLVDGRPVCVPSDMAAMADYVRLCMTRYVHGGFFEPGRFAGEEQVEELMANCRRALAFYDRSGK